jgi:hypothetical protein
LQWGENHVGQEQKVTKRLSWFLMAAGCLLLVFLGVSHFGPAWPASAAVSFIYGNSYGSTPYVLKMNPGTVTVADSFTNLSGSNGRGVVVVSGVMYYTSASTPNIFSYTIATHTNNGSLFSIPGVSGLSTIAFDGTNFWVGDYSGTNRAFLYSMSGTLLSTIHLANCGTNCDGLEYFLQGGTTPRLISNEGDPVSPYDIYDLNGNVVSSHFITTPWGTSASGIAYDGTNFYVSDIFNSKLGYFNGTTGAFISDTAVTGAPSGYPPAFEDLSADYSITLGTPPAPTVPTLSEFGLLLCAILLLASGVILNRRRSAKA